MVLIVKAATNDQSVLQIAWYMLSIELGTRLADDAGQRLQTPVANWPSYGADGESYSVRSTLNYIFVGMGVDIEALAKTLAAVCVRIQSADHFCRPMPIVGSVTTAFVKPTQSATEVNPGRPVGRGIYTTAPSNSTNFYTWIIRRVSALPYDDPMRLLPRKDVVGTIETLSSIVWDIDDIFIFDHGSMPLIVNLSDFRAIAENRLVPLYDPVQEKNIQKVEHPNNTVIIIGGIAEPGMLTMQKTNNNQITSNKGIISLVDPVFKDHRRADNHEHNCANCGCQMYDYAYSINKPRTWVCVRCVSSGYRSETKKPIVRKRIPATTRDSLVAKQTNEIASIINDVRDDVTVRKVAGIKMYLGKKYAYTSSLDTVLYAGPVLYDDPALGLPPHIYIADIYMPSGLP